MIKSFYYIALVWKLKDRVITLEYRSNIVSRNRWRFLGLLFQQCQAVPVKLNKSIKRKYL